jgi:hypothetical protein
MTDANEAHALVFSFQKMVELLFAFNQHLPNYTLEAFNASAMSPQSRALDWLSNYSAIDGMKKWQKLYVLRENYYRLTLHCLHALKTSNKTSLANLKSMRGNIATAFHHVSTPLPTTQNLKGEKPQ